jgi:hypothetical protein
MKVFCTLKHLDTSSKFNRGLMDSGVIGLAGGAILGHLFEMKFMNLNLSYQTWTKTQPIVTAIRVTLSLLIDGIFGALYFLVSTDVEFS